MSSYNLLHSLWLALWRYVIYANTKWQFFTLELCGHASFSAVVAWRKREHWRWSSVSTNQATDLHPVYSLRSDSRFFFFEVSLYYRNVSIRNYNIFPNWNYTMSKAHLLLIVTPAWRNLLLINYIILLYCLLISVRFGRCYEYCMSTFSGSLVLSNHSLRHYQRRQVRH